MKKLLLSIPALLLGAAAGAANEREAEALFAEAKDPVTDLTVVPTSLSLEVGETLQMVATVTPSDAGHKVIWESSNDETVDVSVTGEVFGVSPGPAVVTAIAGGNTATCTVTVRIPEDTPVTGTLGPLTWDFDQGTLTIAGDGPMPDFDGTNEAPWTSFHNAVEEVVVFEGVTHLGALSFYNCNNLFRIELPNGLRSIGEWAFFRCDALEEITVPEGVTEIPRYCFAECQHLKRVLLPSTTRRVQESSFLYLPELMSVTCLATVPPAFGPDDPVGKSFSVKNDTLYVPAGSVDAYKADRMWRSRFKTIAAIP